MKVIVTCFAAFVLSGSLSGCAKTHYAWNNYDTNLYNHYKDPSQKEEFALKLKEALQDAEASKRVPPGIYAEYGFLLYEQGNSLQAIHYYQKEYDLWPESRFFMTKMINAAKKRIKPEKPAAAENTPSSAPKQTTAQPGEMK